MIELLKEFPASWIIVGTIISGAIFFFANHRVFTLQRSATENLARVYKETISALTTERDTYRDKLHRERDAHQATLLENETLKTRPDLTSISELLHDQSNVMKQIGDSLKAHVEDDAKIFKKIDESLSKLPGTLESMTRAFDRRQAEALSKISRK
jgi:hypothetical protein